MARRKRRVIGPMIMRDPKGRGFYIGTMKWDWDLGKYLPYERVSEFFQTPEEVNNAFANLQIEEMKKEAHR